MIAGLLIQGTDVPEDAIHLFFGNGIATLFAPLGKKRARIYVIYPEINGRKGLSGKEKVNEFFQLSQAAGAPSSWFTNAEPIGPLAEFSGADHWVDSPAKNGVALIGDAAASSDPSWGSGLALTLVDVEHLAKALLSTDDWNASLERYANEHDQYYGAEFLDG
jgi:2-polyprenyl-6-methoxyphenol hydroxylase-like FAD-dependent oxidoreductase